MIFTQQMDMNNILVNQQVMKICEPHSDCRDCPLRKRDMNISGTVVRCETGRMKGEENNENDEVK